MICLILNSSQVHRFLVQVATDNIALTGLNFFPVTRTVLLTVSIAGVTQVLCNILFTVWVFTAAVANEQLHLAKHSDVTELYAEHHKMQLTFCAISPIRTRNNITSVKQVCICSKFALTFWKLSAYLRRFEMSEILLRLTLTLINVKTVLPLDALRWLMPSVWILGYSMEFCFD